MPSRAGNFGMTFCEAAAFGVPSITTTAGGIPAAVRDGETGYTLPGTAPPEAFADVLQTQLGDVERYRRIALASAADYRTRLNWEVFTTRLLEICEQVTNR